MFKHVTKSRKLAKHQREARLSDEDSSGASASEPELDSASDASGSDASDSEGSDSDSEFEKDEPETPEEDELLSPAPGYPTIEEALANPIAQPTHEEGKDGELVEAQGLAPVCVVCVNKVLKAGTMLEVHKKSKDHLRRHARFVAHVKSDEFDPAHLPLDAVSLVARLDAQVATRNAPAPAPSTSKPAPTQEELAATAEAERLSSQQKNAALKAKAAAEGRAKREVLREAKHARDLKKRNARNEKKERLKARAAGKAEEGKEAEAEVKKPKAKKAWGVKPTEEQIAARQAKKVAAREAAGIPPPIHPTPKTVWADQLVANNDAQDKAKVDSPAKPQGKKRSRPSKANKA